MATPLSTRTWFLLALASSGSCRQAASVFLDIPPKRAPAVVQGHPLGSPTGEIGFSIDTTPRPVERAAAESALALLPADAEGNVDWVKALRSGVIAPRRVAPGTARGPDLAGFAYDFSFEGPDKELDALFPHSAHVEWLRCQNCHQGGRRSAKPPTMDEVNEGKACGQCHGKVAFSVGTCYRCHTGMEQPTEMAERATMPDEPVKFTRAGLKEGQVPDLPVGMFSHFTHRIRYTCAACHEALFRMVSGDTLTMGAMQGGKSCGACHNGTTAFGLLECDRCHSAATPTGAPSSSAKDGPATLGSPAP